MHRFIIIILDTKSTISLLAIDNNTSRNHDKWWNQSNWAVHNRQNMPLFIHFGLLGSEFSKKLSIFVHFFVLTLSFLCKRYIHALNGTVLRYKTATKVLFCTIKLSYFDNPLLSLKLSHRFLSRASELLQLLTEKFNQEFIFKPTCPQAKYISGRHS